MLFGRVSFESLILDFVVTPLTAVTQMAGLAAPVLDGLYPLPSLTGVLLAHLAATETVESTRLLDLSSWLVVYIPSPEPFNLVSYYLSLSTMFWSDSPVGLRWTAPAAWGVEEVWL